MAYDTDTSDAASLAGSAVPLDELFDIVRKVQSERTLLLIDSGHSAPGSGMELPPGAAIISASERGQRAYELKTGGGLLTNCLIEALRGSGGKLSPVDLFRKVGPEVRAGAREVGQLQEPQLAAGALASLWSIGEAPLAKP